MSTASILNVCEPFGSFAARRPNKQARQIIFTFWCRFQVWVGPKKINKPFPIGSFVVGLQNDVSYLKLSVYVGAVPKVSFLFPARFQACAVVQEADVGNPIDLVGPLCNVGGPLLYQKQD